MPKSVFMRFPQGLAKALTFSYDDGVREDLQLADLFDRHGLKGTFNVNSGRFSEEGFSGTGKRSYLSGAEIAARFADSAHEIAVHAYDHSWLNSQDQATVCLEILRDRERLERLMGRIVKGMAYPYGATNDRVVEALRCCGISYSRTTVSTGKFDLPADWLRLPATCHHNDPRLMELGERFVNAAPRADRGVALLFYVWGHSYEFTDNGNWDAMESFAELVGGREDVWYATNGEIYDYIRDYERLVWSAEGNVVHNPTARTLWFNYDGRLTELASGETKKLN